MSSAGPEIHSSAGKGGQEICAMTQDRVTLVQDEIFRLMPRIGKLKLSDAEAGKAPA